MKKRFLWIIFCCIAILISTSGDLAIAKNKRNKKKVSQIQLLYVQTAMSGSLEETSQGQLTLTLNDVLPSTIWFANRPNRLTGSEPTDGFVEHSWAASGFNEDPPNAALEAEFENDTRSIITLEIESPEYDLENNKITYMAMLLSGEPTEALTQLHANSDSMLSGSFQHSVLFIDGADYQVINGCVIKPYTSCDNVALLNQANLQNADLIGANLTDALLIGANLTGTLLIDANLTGAILTGNANLTSANLSGAILSSANLNGAELTGANLSGAILSSATLNGANLPGAILTGANLSGAELTGANLSEALLIGANLSGANLIGATLREADLTGATLTGANLEDADLTDATLRDADLTDANLREADFTGATWTDGSTCGTANCDGKAD